MNKTSRIASYAAAAVLALATGAWLAASQRGSAGPDVATVYNQPRPFPDIALTDHNGSTFDRDRLRGRWSLLFFGFTHCPDVCPATLQLLKQARAALPQSALPDVVLISVDPARDTPPILARYVAHFDPEFVGVTGTESAIAELTKALYVSHQKIPLDNGGYTVDHSAAVFFVNPSAEIVAVSTPPHGARAIAADFVAIREL